MTSDENPGSTILVENNKDKLSIGVNLLTHKETEVQTVQKVNLLYLLYLKFVQIYFAKDFYTPKN